MNIKLDWLNNQIDRMQAEKSLRIDSGAAGYTPNAEDMAALRTAAQLNARRPGAGQPDAEFLDSLRARMLESMV